MRPKKAAEWKSFYAHEREKLGEVGIAERLDRAAELSLPSGGALVFPHTMLSVTGHLTAAVARAVVRSGADEVLALGVLHGGRRSQADLVKRARGGEQAARQALRKIHEGGDSLCEEEFSLDNFVALLELAARREGKKPPRVHARYPFLVGDDPERLPGIADVAKLAERMPVVATTDPIHHGNGYGTALEALRPEEDAATQSWAQESIQAQLDLLARGQWSAFARLTAEVRSDFRDVGPVLGWLTRRAGAVTGSILELHLVDYAEVLGADAPTWVAGPLMRMQLDRSADAA
ncbi:MAG TPA: hypothetical protein VF765_23175 [Polyangiaceae bacterium]